MKQSVCGITIIATLTLSYKVTQKNYFKRFFFIIQNFIHYRFSTNYNNLFAFVFHVMEHFL